MTTLEPRIIETDEQHRIFLAEIEQLALLDPEPESLEGQRLRILANLVEEFEKAKYPFHRST